jgi:hypothetical protein
MTNASQGRAALCQRGARSSSPLVLMAIVHGSSPLLPSDGLGACSTRCLIRASTNRCPSHRATMDWSSMWKRAFLIKLVTILIPVLLWTFQVNRLQRQDICHVGVPDRPTTSSQITPASMTNVFVLIINDAVVPVHLSSIFVPDRRCCDRSMNQGASAYRLMVRLPIAQAKQLNVLTCIRGFLSFGAGGFHFCGCFNFGGGVSHCGSPGRRSIVYSIVLKLRVPAFFGSCLRALALGRGRSSSR